MVVSADLPPKAPSTAGVEHCSRLQDLQAQIAALSINAEAARKESAAACEPGVPVPMVPVFSPPMQVHEGLSTDRDVTKRHEQIQALLRKRGALRILGAIASPALGNALESLYASHPNFQAAIDYLVGEEILARQRGGALCGLRLLLYGGAGVGKTDFSLTVAKHLAVPSEVISLSAAQAGAYLSGSEEYWSNSKPGKVWEQLIQGTHANPVFVLDEIDKVSDRHGDPLGALYQLLEPRTAAIFCDKSVPWLPLDASRIHWIATANDPEALHPAILSRFTVVAVEPPSEADLQRLIQRLYRDLLAEFQLNDRFPGELPSGVLSPLSASSLRDVKRELRSALARALRQKQTELLLDPLGAKATARGSRIGFV